MKSYVLTIAGLMLLSFGPVEGQKRKAPRSDYPAAAKKCNAALDKAEFARAETPCREALRLAVGLGDKARNEQMKAYENYGFALFSQQKFQAAHQNFTRALEIGRTFLTENDAGLAVAYFNIGRSNHGILKLDDAFENYRKAESIYRTVLTLTTDEALKADYREMIRRSLILQRHLAELRDDRASLTEIEKRIEGLSNPQN